MKTTEIKNKIGQIHLKFLAAVCLLSGAITARAATLGTSTLLVAPSSGTNSVVLATSGAWGATANDSWLHVTQAGTGKANVTFTYDQNEGATRSGTLSIAGQTLTVTQAGSQYVAAGSVTALASDIVVPNGVAVDGAGNVYFSDARNGTVEKWTPASNNHTTLVSGLGEYDYVALDSAGDVYISDNQNNLIKEWTANNGAVKTLISGLDSPLGLAVDPAGNVYFANLFGYDVQEWSASSHTINTILSSQAGWPPTSVTLDAAGNVYIALTTGTVMEYNPDSPETTFTVLISSVLDQPYSVAADGSGDLYIADTYNNAIKKWTPWNDAVTTLVPGASSPYGVAVDGTGNVFFSSDGNGSIEELPYVFVNTQGQQNAAPAGTNALPPVLPTTENLLSPFNPTSDQPWLTITGTANGVVSYSFTLNSTGNNRLAHISLFNQSIPISQSPATPPTALTESAAPITPVGATLNSSVNPMGTAATVYFVYGATTDYGYTNVVSNILSPQSVESTVTGLSASTLYHYQVIASNDMGVGYGGDMTFTTSAPLYSLGAANRLEGPSAGADSVVLCAIPSIAPWTASANAPWLHLSLANQRGDSSTNVIFTFDANPGGTRSDTLTIAGQRLTVTQASSNYVSAGTVTPLVSGLGYTCGVAVDGAGNVYIAATSIHSVKEWTLANNSVTTLVSAGLIEPYGVAVDGSDNVYIANTGNMAVDELAAGTTNLDVIASGQASEAVAVNASGDVYFPETYLDEIVEWTPSAGSNSVLVSTGLNGPEGVAVDAAGNVYIGDTAGNAVKELSVVTGNVITLASAQLELPGGVAVDGAGSVYIGDIGDNTVRKWTAATGVMTTLLGVGLQQPRGVAVDSAGNVYVADAADGAIKEMPYVFVDPTPRSESGNAGSDALPMVLPTTANLLPPFAPTSDQAWLTITGTRGGVVSFSFATNPGQPRTAHITLLGATISVNQAAMAVATPPVLIGAAMISPGQFQLTYSNSAPGVSLTVLATTNLALPMSQWMNLGSVTNAGTGLLRFTDTQATNTQRFYMIQAQ